MLAVVILIQPRAVMGQWPQARLSSLSRAGVRSGESAEVTLRGSDLEGVTQLWFDDPGLSAAHVKDLTFRITCKPDVPLGQHDLRALGTFGVSNPKTFVIGDRPEQVEVEPNNSLDKATPIFVNAVIHGEISSATEIDCFAFEGKKGQRLFLDLHAQRIDSPLDATLRVLSPSGVEIAENRDTYGADPFVDVTLPADGRYMIKIHDAVYAGSADHVYRLVVHDGPHLDGILPMAAAPGSKAEFTIIGRRLGPGALAGKRLLAEGRPLERLAISFATPVESDFDPAVFRTFLSPASGAVYQGFEPALTRINPRGAAPATSNLLVVEKALAAVVAEQEPNNDDAQAQTVVPPCDISGLFDAPGDADVYRFQGHKGDVWKIETFADRQGSPADPSIILQKVDAKGNTVQDLASADDLADIGAGPRFNTQSVDAELRFQVPEDGLYQVVVSDLYSSQRGDPRLAYRLVIRRERPDFRIVLLPASETGPDGNTLRAGGRTTAYVVAIRNDGFAGAIRVEAAVLPAGVRCAPVILGAGQIIAPIVFEAAEDAKTTHGMVRLIGRKLAEAASETSSASSATLEAAHPALTAGMTGPPNASVKSMAPARLVRGFMLAVRGEPAPLQVTATSDRWEVVQGRQIDLPISVTRRAGFSEAVTLTATDLPPNMPAGTATLPKEGITSVLPLYVPKNVPQGTFSFLVRGSGPFAFSKDPKAKDKPKITLTEPSNPITLVVRQAPARLAVDAKGGAIKQGAELAIEITANRQNGFAGELLLGLNAAGPLKLSADSVTLAGDQTRGTLKIRAAKDSPLGAAANITVRATARVGGKPVEMDEPLALTINK
jgi:hypothetical protein